MKKLCTLFAVSALVLTFAACGGNKKNNTTEAAGETTTETTATPAQTAGNDVLDKYEALINQAIDLQAKVAKGDAAASQEYMKIAEEMQSMAGELQTAIANMSEADAQRFAELGQKLANAAQAAYAQ